jgi:hypothetical protein
MMPIGAMATIPSVAQRMGWKSGKHIAVAPMNNSHLCSTKWGFQAYYRPESRKYNTRNICMNTPISRYKYELAHEIGHAISHINYGPLGENYEADESHALMPDQSIDPNFKCSNWDPVTQTALSNSWNWGSREFIETAAGEGFAEFFAAALYNNRNSSSPTFAKSRTSLLPDASGNYIQHTDSTCQPPITFEHLGSAQDWLFFFWGIYSAQSNAFDINEITELWKKARQKSKELTSCARYEHGINYTRNGRRVIEPGWFCRKFFTMGFMMIPVPTLVNSNLRFNPARATHYRHGVPWDRLRNTTENLYGFNKMRLFENTGRSAKVFYE